MRRRAVLIVEYAKESGRPMEREDWSHIIEDFPYIQSVHVEVQEDESA